MNGLVDYIAQPLFVCEGQYVVLVAALFACQFAHTCKSRFKPLQLASPCQELPISAVRLAEIDWTESTLPTTSAPGSYCGCEK